MFKRFLDYQLTSFWTTVLTGVIGFVAGAATWLLMTGLTTFVLTPLFCQSTGSYCSAVPSMAIVMALLVVHFVALIGLIRIGVLRPLLVIIAAIATMWGFHVWLGGASWWSATLLSGLLFGLAYLAYMWINRLLSFPIALVVTVIGIIVTRLLAISW